MGAHTTSDDPTRYRVADEMEAWKLKDPIERLRVHMVREQVAGQEFFDSVEAEADELAARFRDYCFGLPDPPPERMFSEVYAEQSPQVTAQREDYLRYLEGFVEDHAAGGVR
jgi:2-oxoisovalerate dehydrogenase E1 component alpha subunit